MESIVYEMSLEKRLRPHLCPSASSRANHPARLTLMRGVNAAAPKFCPSVSTKSAFHPLFIFRERREWKRGDAAANGLGLHISPPQTQTLDRA